jgi:transposase
MAAVPVPIHVRKAIVRATEKGLTYEATAELLGVGRATVNRVLARYRRTKSVEPSPNGGGWTSPIQGRVATLLEKIVTTMSDATVAELTAALEEKARIKTSRSAVQRALHRLGYTRKKSPSWQRSEIRPSGDSSGESSARASRR